MAYGFRSIAKKSGKHKLWVYNNAGQGKQNEHDWWSMITVDNMYMSVGNKYFLQASITIDR